MQPASPDPRSSAGFSAPSLPDPVRARAPDGYLGQHLAAGDRLPRQDRARHFLSGRSVLRPVLHGFAVLARDSRHFAMCFAPSLILILFALFGGLVLGVRGPTTFVTTVRDRLQDLAPELTERPNLNKQAVATQVFRDYIQAMNQFTEELASIDPVTIGRMGPAELRIKELHSQNVENDFVVAQNLAWMVKINAVDAIAVKQALGEKSAWGDHLAEIPVHKTRHASRRGQRFWQDYRRP